MIDDLRGQKFGKLTVMSAAPRTPAGRIRWHCACDCGASTIASSNNLKQGKHKSCGCIQRLDPSPRRTTYSMRNTVEYFTWKAIKSRCYNAKNQDYHIYGGRGIEVCERWRQDFFAFYADMGQRPGPHYSIDRYPDTSGNYEPANCRWATASQQANNMRANRLITHAGRTQTLAQWGKEAIVSYDRFRMRLNEGWPFDLAMTTPPLKLGQRYDGPILPSGKRYSRPSRRRPSDAIWK